MFSGGKLGTNVAMSSKFVVVGRRRPLKDRSHVDVVVITDSCLTYGVLVVRLNKPRLYFWQLIAGVYFQSTPVVPTRFVLSHYIYQNRTVRSLAVKLLIATTTTKVTEWYNKCLVRVSLRATFHSPLAWLPHYIRCSFEVLYFIHAFYRATRMHSADYAVARCPSVRLSVCHTPVLCLND